MSMRTLIQNKIFHSKHARCRRPSNWINRSVVLTNWKERTHFVKCLSLFCSIKAQCVVQKFTCTERMNVKDDYLVSEKSHLKCCDFLFPILAISVKLNFFESCFQWKFFLFWWQRLIIICHMQSQANCFGLFSSCIYNWNQHNLNVLCKGLTIIIELIEIQMLSLISKREMFWCQQVYWNLRTGNIKRWIMRTPNVIVCNCGGKTAVIRAFYCYFHPYTFSAVDLINRLTSRPWQSNKIPCWRKHTGKPLITLGAINMFNTLAHNSSTK